VPVQPVSPFPDCGAGVRLQVVQVLTPSPIHTLDASAAINYAQKPRVVRP
jgi:hypothetical protein